MIIGANAPEISVHPEVLVAMAIVTDYSIETCRGTEARLLGNTHKDSGTKFFSGHWH